MEINSDLPYVNFHMFRGIFYHAVKENTYLYVHCFVTLDFILTGFL